jgi:hypothetical protein
MLSLDAGTPMCRIHLFRCRALVIANDYNIQLGNDRNFVRHRTFTVVTIFVLT